MKCSEMRPDLIVEPAARLHGEWCPATSRSRTARRSWARWPRARRACKAFSGRRGLPGDAALSPGAGRSQIDRAGPGSIASVHGRGLRGLASARTTSRWTAAARARPCACCRASWPASPFEHPHRQRGAAPAPHGAHHRAAAAHGREHRGRGRRPLPPAAHSAAGACTASTTLCPWPAPRSSRACCWRGSMPTATHGGHEPAPSRDHTERMLRAHGRRCCRLRGLP